MDGRLHDEPGSVASEKDQVIVDGPDGVAVTLTPEAADETGHRLIDSASEAAGFRGKKQKSDKAQAN